MTIQYQLNPVMKELTTLHHLVHQHGLTLEAAGTMGASLGILNRFFSFGEKTIRAFKQFAKAPFKTFIDTRDSRSEWEIFGKVSENYQYNVIKNIPYYVNVGFAGNVADYAELLSEIHDKFSMTFIYGVLKPVNLTLAKYINQPTLLESMAFDNLSLNMKEIDKYKKELGKYIGRGKGTDTTIGKAFARGKDLKTLESKLQYFSTVGSLEKDGKNHLMMVKEEVLAISEKVDIIIDILKDRSKGLNTSEYTLRQLSDLLFTVAQQVEFYSLVDNLIYGLVGVSRKNVSELIRLVDTDGIATEEVNDKQESLRGRLNTLPSGWQSPAILSWFNFVQSQDFEQLQASGKQYGTDFFHSPLLSLEKAYEVYHLFNSEDYSQLRDIMSEHFNTTKHETVRRIDVQGFYQYIPIAFRFENFVMSALFIDLCPSEKGTAGQIINHRGQVVAANFDALLYETNFLSPSLDDVIEPLHEISQRVVGEENLHVEE